MEALIVQLGNGREGVLPSKHWMWSRPSENEGDVCPEGLREDLAVGEPDRIRPAMKSHFRAPELVGLTTYGALRAWAEDTDGEITDDQDRPRGEVFGRQYDLDLVWRALRAVPVATSTRVRVGVIEVPQGLEKLHALRLTFDVFEVVVMGLNDVVPAIPALDLDMREAGPSAVEAVPGIPGRTATVFELDDPTGDDVCADAPGAQEYLQASQ